MKGRRLVQGQAIGRELLGLVAEVIGDCAEAKPGAQELVKLIGERVPVAVASNSPRVLLDVALRLTDPGLVDWVRAW